MAQEYRMESEKQDNLKIMEILEELPAYVTTYTNHIQFSTTPKTRLGYIRDIRTFLQYILDASGENFPSIKDIPASYLETVSLDFFNSYLVYISMYESENGQVRRNTNVSVRRKLSSLRNMYAYLFLNDMISTNPVMKVQIPKVPKKELIRMDNGETGDFLRAVETGAGPKSKMEEHYYGIYAKRDTMIMNILLSTGIRVSELVGLDIKDVDLLHSGIRIIRKGGKEDIIYYNDKVREMLKDYIEYRKKIISKEGHENALFLSSQKRRITVRSVENLVKKYAGRASLLKKITPHKLRATYGTALYEETNDLYLVAEVLGHESVETTRKHYTEVTNRHKYENRNAVDYQKNQG